MLVYNITIKIVPAIEKEWKYWQQQEHIPEIMATGFFTEYKFYKLLEQDNDDGITYIVQYFSESHDLYNRYIKESAPVFRQKALDKWGEKFIAFRTVLQVVN